MNAEYQRDLQKNYLVLLVPEGTREDDYPFQMALQNKITGLLPFHMGKKDGKMYLHYDITSRTALTDVFGKHVMGYQDILELLNGLQEILETLQRYLLSPQGLLFDPQYIFYEPNTKKPQFCYYSVKEHECPFSLLSEFILKRLDHEDRQAVVLGYSLYQKTQEHNFSLQQALKEVLALIRKEASFPQISSEPEISMESRTPEVVKEIKYDKEELPSFDDFCGRNEEKQEYTVTHKERKSKKKTRKNPFEKIHPAVFGSFLTGCVLLEVLYGLGWIDLSEMGGFFFFLSAVEVMVNRFWIKRKQKKKENDFYSVPDEEDEMFRILKEEMYQEKAGKTDAEAEELYRSEETRCLIFPSQMHALRMVSVLGDRERYPDIVVQDQSLYVGKIKGESDVILDSPTVSRRHARIDVHADKFYVKDMNSKNGTFLNGDRLQPQERRELRTGDHVTFAEIEYRCILP